MAVELKLTPEDEERRLQAVRRFDVLDTPPDGAFDRITALAARHFDVPISIISIVDRDRIWFKSHHGVDVDEVGRDPGLCASAILQYEPWVVEDAAVDPRTLANPLVAGELGLRFYAGAPLTTRNGVNLGTLCVIDQEPRQLTDEQRATLRDMAAIVVDELELRLSARRAVEREHALRDHAERTARALQESLLPAALPDLPGAEVAALYRPAQASVVGGDFYDVFELEGGGWALVVGDVSGKGSDAAAVTALARHAIRTASLTADGPSDVLAKLNQTMLLGRSEVQLEHFATAHVSFLCPQDDGLKLLTAGAGHPPALLFGSDGDPRRIASAGPPAGIYADAHFPASETLLGSGAGLVIYTDGITEARRGGQLLGDAGLAAALGQPTGVPAASVITRLYEAISAPDVEITDDVAVLVLRVL